MAKRIGSIIVSVIVLLSLLISGCGPLKSAKSIIDSLVPTATSLPTSAISASASIPPRGTTGTISIGQTVAASTTTVTPGGGILSVNKPGDPLDSMQIAIPSGAYSTSLQFKISYAPVTGNSFGADCNPITPLISVDNGGQFANEMMEVTIPVKIPEDSFAMGFIYDKTTKTLEGMPLLAESANSITVGTCHFTDFFISLIPKINLKNDIDSHFRPGVDDWEFTNRGSYIAPSGHCAGQSMTAMWYYCTQPDGKDLILSGRYDNNGNLPATPGLWQDDSLGYRFASVIQADNWNDLATDVFSKLANTISQENTWNCFAYAMQLTAEPQLVFIWSKAGGGHAMIIYRIKDGDLCVADPNYPGMTDRVISYGFGKFLPYSSGDNKESIDAGKSKVYETIEYAAKSAVVSFSHIAARWQELKNKTVGDGSFPEYTINFLDKDGKLTELLDRTAVSNRQIMIGVEFTVDDSLMLPLVYRDGAQLKLDAETGYTLNPGNNLLGIWITKEVVKSDGSKANKYVDFRYLNVVFGGLPISPSAVSADPGKTVNFTVPGITEKVLWSVQEGIGGGSISAEGIYTAPAAAGTYHVVATLNSDHTVTGTAAITVAAGNSFLAILQKTTRLHIDLGIQMSSDVLDLKTNKHSFETIALGGITVDCQIIWSGTSFSGKSEDLQTYWKTIGTISGSVSPDGKTVSVSWSLSRTYTVGGKAYQTMQLVNVPLYIDTGYIKISQNGTAVGNYLTKLEYGSSDDQLTQVFSNPVATNAKLTGVFSN